MKNLKIREMQITLKKYIEEICLPVEVKRLVLKEIYNTISDKADKAISVELKDQGEIEQKEVNMDE